MSAEIIAFPKPEPAPAADPAQKAVDKIVHDTYMQGSEDAVKMLQEHFRDSFNELSGHEKVAAAAHLAEKVFMRCAGLMQETVKHREKLAREQK